MSARNTSRDTSANPSKDSPTCRGRDGRKAAQDDDSSEPINKPPDRKSLKGSIQKFIELPPKTRELEDIEPSAYLQSLDKDTPLKLIGEFALANDICTTDQCTQFRRLKRERISEGDADE